MTDGWLKLNFSSCVTRRHAHWARLCYVPFVIYMVVVNYIYDMVVDTQFHQFHGRPFARVRCLFLMKNIGR